MNRDGIVVTKRLRRCAFGYLATLSLNSAAAWWRPSEALEATGRITNVVRAGFCLHLPAALLCRTLFARQNDNCIELQR
jgi:hypothetical protein